MKNKQTKILKESKGITLIALVITIIILLILAAVSIATLTGENGVLTKATKAEEETEKAEAEEQVNLAVLASYDNSGNLNYKELENNLRKISNITGVPSPITELPIGVDVNGYSIIINNNGTLEMSKIQIGDYVAYDPTKSDAEGTTAVDSELLTYQSPVGGYSEETGRIEHGNGSSVQTFTAKPNDGTENGLKWRVLEVQGDKITLISNTKVKTDNNENFILKGGIGYLYAEQEAHEACKIYGYGYGAYTNIITKCKIGGPYDAEEYEIEGSGARSITMEDINKKAGIYYDKSEDKMKYSDGTLVSTNFGSTENPTIEVYYPTLTSNNTENPGQSEDKKKNMKSTSYKYDKSKITDKNVQDMLFSSGGYMIASQFFSLGSGDCWCIRPTWDGSEFRFMASCTTELLVS